MQITGGRAENGAGILITNASPNIRRTVIFKNFASGSGAGVLVTGRRSDPALLNNLISYNADSTPDFTDAHQVFVDSGARAVIINNTIVRGNGNAILVQDSRRPSEIRNNLLVWNGSVRPNGQAIGRGICDFSGSARIHYNLFYRNKRAAILTGDFDDIRLIGDAEASLGLGRVTQNLDGDPHFFRPPGVDAPSDIVPERFVPRSGPAARAGDPRSGFRNLSGTRNTIGHTGGPFGWR